MRTVSIAVAAVVFLGGGVAAAADAFAWTPAGAPVVVRGRQVADQFDLLWTGEITVAVDDAFAPANRRALMRLEQALRQLPGVRQVWGPAGLLNLTADSAGNITARPLFDPAAAPSGDASAADSEALRQQLATRGDAAGWFLAADGRTVRFLVESNDFERARPAIARAIAGAALTPTSATGPVWSAAALWPDPRDHVLAWAPLVAIAVWIAFAWMAAAPVWRHMGTLAPARALAVMFAAALGGGCLFLLAPLAPLRHLGQRSMAVAVGATALALIIERVVHGTVHGATGRLRVSLVTVVLATVIAAAGAATVGRVRLGTQQWQSAPLLFVSVRSDLDQPVVLREVRRLTDFLRAQRGVAGAWSVADLFDSVDRPADEPSRIPDQADDVRRVLAQGRGDAAVRLELSSDHREALVIVRFEAVGEQDRPAFLERVARYLDGDLRASLARVDLRDPVSPATRALGRGLLAVDATERILRICDRAGRNLGEPERQAVERVARRAALIPVADVVRLRAEVTAEVRAFLRLHAPAVDAAERERVAAALVNLDGDASLAAVSSAVVGAFAPARPPPSLSALLPPLARQLAEVRSRHAARFYFKDILAGAGLPADGPLADQVRAATRDAMGPIVGLPVPRGTAGAIPLDVMVVGGAAHDRALSAAWLPGLRAGAIFGAVGLAIVLVLVAGFRGVLWYPLALALPAAALIVPALTRDPIGVLFVGFLAGTCAAGAALATALAARRAP